MAKINKEELVRRLKIAEMFNADLPKWFWKVLDSVEEYKDAESGSRISEQK